MRQFILAFLLTISVSISAMPNNGSAGSYCLGEWPTEVGTYCDGLMIYARSLVADRLAGVSKEEALKKIPYANATFRIPSVLAENYIEFVWGIPERDLSADTASNLLIGGCIDNYDVIIKTLEAEH